ncbi:MAG: hypothetical protein ACT6S0_14795 [Roseateles sp.]|uniref:hypothetical protein n=1 Tax=Roseateles sp. TaxID=1971397 RepID=UPI0040361D3D
MKTWKLTLGLGAACAACCAIPLIAAAGGLAALGGVLVACADELLPFAGALVLLAGAAFGVYWWKRRRALRTSTCGCAASCTAAGCDAAR